MRRLASLLLLLALACPAVADLDAAAKKDNDPTCFGKNATIADHTGSIVGTPGDDVIVGDDGPNFINVSQGGRDRVCAGAGDDEIEAFDGDAALADGGPGADQIFGSGDGDLLRGGTGDDLLDGNAGDDRLDGGAGNDDLVARSGDDTLDGGDGDDTLVGGLDADRLGGGAGSDTLLGDDESADVPGGGPDDLFGGGGIDRLVGGEALDALAGGKGGDVCDQDFEESGEASFPC